MKQGGWQWVRNALGGAILGLVGALLGAIVGARRYAPVGFEEGFVGLFSGAALGYTLGVPAGVYLVGRLSGTGGAFWLTVGGAALGSGWLVSLAAMGFIDAFVYLALPGCIASLALAVLGYNRGFGLLRRRLKE
jgi:hypothetical protein